MSPDKMVRMVNQIATFFDSQPMADKPSAVAAHLIEFWEPRMLEKLSDHLAAGGEGLSDLAHDAAKQATTQTA